MFAPVLERLAECETKMLAVDCRGVGRRFRGAQRRQFILREPVGLEVGETPPGIAEARPAGRRAMVGIDGLLTPAESFLRMRDRQVQIRIGRRSREQLLEEHDGPFVFTESGAAGRIQIPVGPIPGFQREQLRELGAGRLMTVQLEEDAGVLVAGEAVIRRALDHRGKQELGIVQHVAHNADAGEEPHPFEIIAVIQ